MQLCIEHPDIAFERKNEFTDTKKQQREALENAMQNVDSLTEKKHCSDSKENLIDFVDAITDQKCNVQGCTTVTKSTKRRSEFSEQTLMKWFKTRVLQEKAFFNCRTIKIHIVKLELIRILLWLLLFLEIQNI